MTNSRFSVLMSIYIRENPAFLEQSLQSLLSQTRKPDEIVIVKDGDLSVDLDEVIARYARQNPGLFNVVGYATNRGLGEALNYGMQYITTPIVARMDGDDIAASNRFEEQISFMEAHTDIAVLGSCISEFDNDPAHTMRTRKVPESHEQIVTKARLTNPMNHMTVVFRKDSVLKAGGYQHAPYFEDYDLWVRMLSKGMKFHNLQSNLVLARVGNDMVGKRHGLRYAGYEFSHFRKMQATGFIGTVGMAKAVLLRLPFRLMPKPLLVAFYRFVLRKDL
jgi:glycosyltransferase involved in cell wall biosynthesis